MIGAALRRRGPLDRGRLALAGVVALLLAVPVAALLTGDGYPRRQVGMAGGGAWLVSARQGLVTLIDGASEQVVASLRVPGAQPGDDLSVVQSGPSAYAVNATRGTVSQLDGRSYVASDPVLFGGGAGLLDVFAGHDAVYVVDPRRRIAAVADPATLRVRARLSLAARPGPGQAVLDGRDRLWVVDGAGGGLMSFTGREKRVRRDVGGHDDRLVLVQGEPVLVSVAGRRLGRLDAAGAVTSWTCLDVRPGEPVQTLGSAGTARVFAAVPATGTLVMSSLDDGACSAAVVVGAPGDDFGPLAEAAGYILVPNRSSGHTTVVDVSAGTVVADLPVVPPRTPLELTAKDTFVFYNDPSGRYAGVLRLVEGRWVAGRAISKFRPSDTGTDLLADGGTQPSRPALPRPSSPLLSGPPTPPEQGAPELPGLPQPNPADPFAPRPGADRTTGPTDPTQPRDPGPSDPPATTPPGTESPDPGPSDPGPSDPGPSDPGPSDPGPSGSNEPPAVEVTATVSVNPTTFDGPCPKQFDFTATIQVAGRAFLRYRWIRSDGATTPEETVLIWPTGPQSTIVHTVHTTWTLSAEGGHWQAIQITSPTPVQSNHADFTLACRQPTTVTASVDHDRSVACPDVFTFHGVIRVTSGPMTVRYTWIRSDSALGPVETLTFPGTGPQEASVTDTWTLSANGTHWEAVKIVDPFPNVSNHAEFTVTC